MVDKLLEVKDVDANKEDKDGCTALHIAANQRHTETLMELLTSDDIDVNKTDKNGYTALHHAVLLGHKDIVYWLLRDNGIKVNKKNIINDGMTALHFAANKCHIESLKVLLEPGLRINVNVNEEENDGKTALHFAADRGNKEIVDRLLDVEGIDVNKMVKTDGCTALHLAANSDHAEIVKLLVGVKGFFRGIEVNMESSGGNTALRIAVVKGNKNSVWALLDVSDIEVYSKDKRDGSTILHLAVKENHTEVVRTLLRRAPGFDVNEKFIYKDGNRVTPLHLAVKNGNEGCVELLLNKEANINVADDFGNTPMHYAAMNNQFGCALALFNKGANINECNNEHWTPINLAIHYGYRRFMELKGLDDAKNKDIIDGLYKAAESGKADELEKLIKSKEDIVKKSDHDGNTALHHAAFGGSVECVKILLKYGAEINAVNHDGITPLQMATGPQEGECFKLLIQQGADTTVVDEDGHTLLHVIALRNKITWLDLFDKAQHINSQNNKGNTPIHIAALSHFKELLEKLVDIEGADITIRNKEGWTPRLSADSDLMEAFEKIEEEILKNAGETPQRSAAAAKKNKLECCKLLDDKLNEKLCAAAMVGNVAELKRMHSAGATIDGTDKSGKTALQYAAKNDDCIDCLKYLIFCNANINKTDESGKNAMHYAAEKRSIQCLKELMRHEPDTINGTDKSDKTPLHYVMSNAILTKNKKDKELLRKLCNKYKDKILPINASRALRIAINADYPPDDTKMLIERIHIKDQDEDGKTLLHSAAEAENGCVYLKEFLEKEGSAAAITHQDDKGRMPLHCAALRGRINSQGDRIGRTIIPIIGYLA
ncbi:ankyrin repeat domain-containing protein, partial [Endozoicomonas sp. ONNA2]|uniref:ankyrin repeat domain-containing protein n=1 Tax=Endozoicomonas sp. ONNA2 TaxID=2828741 RepID=UPI002147F9D1